MYQRVLVTLDNFNQEEALLPYVEDLSRHYSAKVEFLHIEEEALMLGWDEVIDLPAYHKAREQIKKKGESYLTALQDKLADKGIEVNTRIVYGSALKSILGTVEETNADLIVMTKDALNKYSQEHHGNILASLLQRTNRPLLMVQ